jgi:hypothetical protein
LHVGAVPETHATMQPWAIPLPQREEPLVVAATREPVDLDQRPELVPLARNQAPVPWRDGFMAHMEAWWRGAAERLGRMIRSNQRGARIVAIPARSHARARPQPMMPAIARANREINALRQENERLRRELATLEMLRGQASPARSSQPPRRALDPLGV